MIVLLTAAAGLSIIRLSAAGHTSSTALAVESRSGVTGPDSDPLPRNPPPQTTLPPAPPSTTPTTAAPPPAAPPATASAPITAAPATTAQAASGYGCAAALSYLAAHAAPGFSFECPGNALGRQAMTCENVAGVCPGARLIAIADPCPAAYMNEAYNSRVAEGLASGPYDPYGYCRA